MDKPYFLETAEAFGHYDEAKQVIFIVYSGYLTAETTTRVYQWVTSLFQNNIAAPSRTNGTIFDFRKVTGMGQSNQIITRTESEEINQKFDLSAIPVALIVPHNNLHGMVQQILEDSPQPERKRIVFSIEEAFLFLNQFRQQPDQALVNILDTPHVSCHYDEAHCLAYIAYYGELTADVTAQVYGWLASIFDHYGVKTMRRCIFDFRKVSRFDHTNTRKIVQTSGQLNFNYDMSHIPVGLIVRDEQQERLIRLTMNLTPQEKRKKIVKSIDEAWTFMDNFHASSV